MQAEHTRTDGGSNHPYKNKTREKRGSSSEKATRNDSEKASSGRICENPADRSGGGRLEDEDIPKSDWGRTLDTAVSIPEGPEERADEHEANASLEHALERGIAGDDGAVVLVASKGGVDMTALNASADSTNF